MLYEHTYCTIYNTCTGTYSLLVVGWCVVYTAHNSVHTAQSQLLKLSSQRQMQYIKTGKRRMPFRVRRSFRPSAFNFTLYVLNNNNFVSILPPPPVLTPPVDFCYLTLPLSALPSFWSHQKQQQQKNHSVPLVMCETRQPCCFFIPPPPSRPLSPIPPTVTIAIEKIEAIFHMFLLALEYTRIKEQNCFWFFFFYFGECSEIRKK